MSGPNEDLPLIFLRPGELFFSDKPEAFKVTTVLGSCISITMYSSRLSVAAMCHAVMPFCSKAAGCTGSCHEPYRYVDCAAENMIKKFQRYGIAPKETEVKLFGGADMFESGPSVGRQNIETAIKIIEDGHFRLINTDLGGTVGRKVIFFPHSGRVLLKRLRSIMIKV